MNLVVLEISNGELLSSSEGVFKCAAAQADVQIGTPLCMAIITSLKARASFVWISPCSGI